MAISEEDLEQKRARNNRLREQIAAQEAKASSAIQEQSLTVDAAKLDAETARLEAQLAAAKEQAKVSNIRQGSSDLHEQLVAAKESASAVTPPGVVVDTNAEKQPSDTGATTPVDQKKE